MADIKYEIIRNIGVLSEGSKGWKREVNIVSWNDRSPKLDIRDWSETHDKMGKGITLTKDELASLKEILNDLDLDSLDI